MARTEHILENEWIFAKFSIVSSRLEQFLNLDWLKLSLPEAEFNQHRSNHNSEVISEQKANKSRIIYSSQPGSHVSL
ncbi:hypothetical protein BpHYR1_041593 [Brachionus plicatilis]|uniref:Uncharacterized protein n=1 Tax=Brachionus plicatilis TaxID=10195 RepID=A0A3M7SRK9_BRAPC|nr:hypothetical protein BpHYR1_041593 [Brachionus plicatilis]